MGFAEIQHAADWALHVWAEDVPSLFAEAARGMNSLEGLQLAEGPRMRRNYEVKGQDIESLLVAFLSELLYAQEQERLGFDLFDIRLPDRQMSASLQGASILSMDKAIKAVTYHNLKIEETQRGYEVEIVFDV